MHGPARAAILAAAAASLTGSAAAQDSTAMFPKGAWSLQAYGSGSFDFIGADEDGEIYLAHAGGGYYFVDNLSINLEGLAGHIDAGDGADDGYAYGFDLLLRWHFLNLQDPGVSFYLDGGAGMIWAENPFPVGGTHQNFTPQGGVGAMWRLREHLNLMTGARWQHISNAGKDGPENNPGYDGIMVYAGLQMVF